MIGWRRETKWVRQRQIALAVMLAGAMLLGAIGNVVVPGSAIAQSEGDWIDPAASSQMTDIGDVVDPAIAGVWEGDSGDDWLEPAPVQTAPVVSSPSYDANGN